jgi:hypothetical protein
MSTIRLFFLVAALLLLDAGPAMASEESDLAAESQNPIGNLISLNLEPTISFGAGPEEDDKIYALTAKPVYPVRLTEDWTLINRMIIPFVYSEVSGGDAHEVVGLADTNYQAYFTPAKPGPIIWGAGFSLNLPTHTDELLGTDKLSMGPAIVILAKPGRWVTGVLAYNLWSVAGDSNEPDVNTFLTQYFLNYNFESFYLTSSPTFTADWKAEKGNRWTAPLGGGIGKVFKTGGTPLDLKFQVFRTVVRPDGAAGTTLQFNLKWLFPK